MSNEVINQVPTLERAKEFEQQAKEGLEQSKLGQDKAIIACHKMRDTKAYKTLGFESYYAWGESALNLKKSRLNELAVAGEVQQELLSAVVENETEVKDTAVSLDSVKEAEVITPADDDSFSGAETITETETNSNDESDVLTETDSQTISNVPDLSVMSTPHLLALAKAPKGERLAVLDIAADEAKAEDKPLTTNTIKEAVKASAKPVEYIEPSAEEKAVAIKKQHRSTMVKVSKLNDVLIELDTSEVNSEEVESWKIYLGELKQSISDLEKGLGFE